MLKAFNIYSVLLQSNKEWKQLLKGPIWYNELTKVGGKCIFYKTWYDKGIIHFTDLINEKGQFLSYEDVLTRFSLKTNFLTYYGIIKTLKNIRNNCIDSQLNSNIERPFIPLIIEQILKEAKGCQNFYKTFVDNDTIPSGQTKWHRKINLHNNFKWSTVYLLTHKVTQDTQLKWLQTRILHRILATNTFLFKIGLRDNELCTFCNIMPETIEHLFWECPISKSFWLDLTEWLKGKCNHLQDMSLTQQDVLFGIHSKQKPDRILNLILLHAKSYIYKSKLSKTNPVVYVFKKDINFCYKNYRYIASNNCEWESFSKLWQPYMNLIESV